MVRPSAFLPVLSVPLRLGRAKVSPPGFLRAVFMVGLRFGGFASGERARMKFRDAASAATIHTFDARQVALVGSRAVLKPYDLLEKSFHDFGKVPI